MSQLNHLHHQEQQVNGNWAVLSLRCKILSQKLEIHIHLSAISGIKYPKVTENEASCALTLREENEISFCCALP